MKPIAKILSAATVCGVAIAMTGCAKTEAPAPVAAAPAFKLPVSLNEVMVALVNHSADPIWIAEHDPPKDDKGWRELERHALQLQVAGALLAIPGTGPKDEEWTSRPEWQGFAKSLGKAGEAAVAAVRSRDHALILQSGNEIVDICEGCHKVFKPELPTMKMFGELSPHDTGNGEKK
jgi:hypothetical protein